ncbi:MAG: hypothetical protein M1818_008406 [Claussenomyces sp. TS43310]|nr:MAG: hypothetical protein M1818_008406 [Claussenomyces sp. TS43310]
MWKLNFGARAKAPDEEPFLLPEKDADSSPSNYLVERLSGKTAVVHTLLITLNIILAITLLFFIQNHGSHPETHRFLKGAIQYKQSTFLPIGESPWSGEPTSEVDAAWNKLLHDGNIRVSEAELLTLNQTSIDLSSGKLAWLELTHQMHCVDYIRKALLYRNHYHPEVTDQEWERSMHPHVEHCLNDLLQTVMCNADTTLKVFKWEASKDRPVVTSNYGTPRTCVDLEHLKNTLKDRVVSYEEMRHLKNPLS